MQLSEIIGQGHAYKLGQLLIEQKPKMILITGPSGCGKTSYAEALVSGFGGDGCSYRFIPDELSGEWSIIDGLLGLTRDQWGRLIELVDLSENHTTILITPDLDTVPKAVQNRATRVSLRALQDTEVRAFAENILVRSRIPYSPKAVDQLLLRSRGDLRTLNGILNMAIANNGLTESLLVAFGDDLPTLACEIFAFLVDGYVPEAKVRADHACLSFSPSSLAKELLEQYSKAWTAASGPLGARIKFRFPDPRRATEVLLKWMASQTPIGTQIGAILIQELDVTGIKVEDPRIVEERRKAEEAKASTMLKGRPELNLDPTLLANRKNPSIPLYEDKSIPMDPRIREQLRKEAEEVQKAVSKAAHMIPSSVLSEASVGDTNPFGLRIPPPSQVPKGCVLGTQFSKLARAKKVPAEEKWDMVYQEKEIKAQVRAEIVQITKEIGGEILSEDNAGFQIKIPREHLPEVLALDDCEVVTVC